MALGWCFVLQPHVRLLHFCKCIDELDQWLGFAGETGQPQNFPRNVAYSMKTWSDFIQFRDCEKYLSGYRIELC